MDMKTNSGLPALKALFPELDRVNIVLWSTSPQRKRLLYDLGLVFETQVPTFEENLDKLVFKGRPDLYVHATAHGKLRSIFDAGLASSKLVSNLPCIYITCDTVVYEPERDRILEKPKDAEDARCTLASLSDAVHAVYTSVCLYYRQANTNAPEVLTDLNTSCFIEKTEVHFYALSDNLIDAYVRSGEAYNKAGSYAIQGVGQLFVKGICGCFDNVVGLPRARLVQEMVALIKRYELN